MTKITFGTDGWRAIMGREFALNSVKVYRSGYIKLYEGSNLKINGDCVLTWDGFEI